MDNAGEWDVDLLHDIFDEHDVARITKTPTSLGFSDKWYWKGNLRGQYTVNHGYNFQMRELEQ